MLRQLLRPFIFLLLAIPAWGIERASHTVKECGNLDGNPEKCVWVHGFDAPACPSGACKDLVVFFAGSDMGCQNYATWKKRTYGVILEQYARQGFLAVVACAYESIEKPVPLALQGKRLDLLMKDIRSNDFIKGHWTEENLLIAGVSLGASVPVVHMARTREDDEEKWQGKQFTGACLHDGVYDIQALDQFFLEHSCQYLRSSSLCKRYGLPARCELPVPLLWDVMNDSIIDAGVSEFRIRHWKLIECGSALNNKCGLGGDRIPEEPIRKVCSNLDREVGYDCEFGHLSKLSHMACAFTDVGIRQCVDWFRRKKTLE